MTTRLKRNIDLGMNHHLKIPRHASNPRIEKLGAMIEHKKPDGSDCWGHIYFYLPAVKKLMGGPDSHYWQVHSWNPLTLSPSIRCLTCGDHGYVRESRWVPA